MHLEPTMLAVTTISQVPKKVKDAALLLSCNCYEKCCASPSLASLLELWKTADGRARPNDEGVVGIALRWLGAQAGKEDVVGAAAAPDDVIIISLAAAP